MTGHNVAILGGGGFVGRAIGRGLLERQANVVCLNRRGESGDRRIPGIRVERGDPQQVAGVLDRVQADIVIDCIGLFEHDTLPLIDALDSRGGRYVLLSSCDVYAAFGRVLGTEPGDVDNSPLVEASPIRTVLHPYARLGGPAEYDKIPLETYALNASQLGTRIARLPAMFGPGDPRHRFRDVVECVSNGTALEISKVKAAWRFAMVYVEDVGDGVAIYALKEDPVPSILHFGPDQHPTQAETQREFASAAGHELSMEIAGRDEEGRYDQHIMIDSSRARKELCWSPKTEITDAYRETWAWEAGLFPKTA
ncbi:NAD-dependent epimerase/dehydratase family protein [Hyphobacterium sp.]|jgi:nucleoside-diphosphate-sugar epimerase|uniref:NAD-dependent epimerase/dehydratase family protein n=1 Tax=Hyphobacterium sp. TaxID=2004662 RepID=UPI003BAB099E